MKLSEMRAPVTPQKINKVMESRFGFSVDYDNLTYAKAQRLSKAIGENIVNIKRSFGAHTAEKNPKYVELMLVKEGLDRWMGSEQGLFESEMGKSEAVLAAKDIVDTIQDMIEKVGKVQNEQLPALIDTIRDQIGAAEADAFKNAVTPVLATVYESLTTGREGADSASRALAGEQIDQPMNMGGMGGGQMGQDELAGMAAGNQGSDFDYDETDGFNGTDGAAGGDINNLEEPELGRKRR